MGGRVQTSILYAKGGKGGYYKKDGENLIATPTTTAHSTLYYNFDTVERTPPCDPSNAPTDPITGDKQKCYTPWVRSKFPPAKGIDPWVDADCLLHIKMNQRLCSTCCCAGGLTLGRLGVSLVKQTPGHGCRSWFNFLEAIIRALLGFARATTTSMQFGAQARCFD